MSWFHENSSSVPVTKAQTGLSMRDNLFGLMDGFFKDWGSSLTTSPNWSESIALPINVSETENAYVIETELPGVKKKDIQIDLHDNVLSIKGEKKAFTEEKKDQFYRMERSHGSFMRSIRLPNDVDDQKINAKIEEGVLRIEISKTADSAKKKRAIAIN